MDLNAKNYIVNNFGKRMDKKSSSNFKNTNKAWNDGKFNHSKNVGSISWLMKKYKPNSYEAWIDCYLKSGDEYNSLIKSKSVNINYNHYGRDAKTISNLSVSFKDFCNKNYPDLKMSSIDALDFVLIRIFDESYRGFVRERNIIQELRKLIPNIQVSPSTMEADFEFKIDAVCHIGNTIIKGIQIKPFSFKKSMDTDFKYVDNYTQNGFKKFKKKYNADCMYLFYNDKGKISVSDELYQLIEFSKKRDLIEK